MRTIYKYPLMINDYQSVSLPEDYRIVHIGVDPNGQLCLWAEVDTSKLPAITLPVFVWLKGTGHSLDYWVMSPPVRPKHFTSFVDGPFVWHVYLLPGTRQ